MTCDFYKDLEFSMGNRQKMDELLIKSAIPNCVSVTKTDVEADKSGIDYYAMLDGGAIINIDAKARRKGAVKKGEEPLLALEIWSVCPTEGNKGKVGWTCSRSTDVDMILYTFDPSEWDKFYLVPFQLLRMAFRCNFLEWRKNYKPRKQDNGSYKSEAMFVPASVVLRAVAEQMIYKRN